MRRNDPARAFLRQDLVTADPDRAAEFLRGWLPWVILGAGDRRMIRGPGGPLGEVRLPDPHDPARPGWRCTAEVPDLDRARDRVARMGGRVLAEASSPTENPVLDPDGNGLVLRQRVADEPPPVPAPGAGTVVRHVLTTERPEAVLPFYGEVLGWEIREDPQSTSERRWMGFVRGTPVTEVERLSRGARRPPGWVPYVLVDAMDSSFRQAWESGAQPLSQPADLPGPGRTALVAGPGGLLLGLFQWREV